MNERKDLAGDEAFAEKAKHLFDESVENLDANTRSRLNRGRQAALEQLAGGRPAWVQWVPAAGVAAAAVFAVVLWTGEQPADELTPMASDFEILLTEESFEMLEDLEFYSWMELDEDTQQSPEPEDVVG